jgi:hypothetical protein
MAKRRGYDSFVMDDEGKRTALTPSLGQAVIDEISAGRWPQLAAVRCGVDPRTLRKWLEKGLDDIGVEPYRSFTMAFLKAEADWCAQLEQVLWNSATGQLDYEPGKPRPNVETAKYLLERRMGVLWGTGRGQSGLEAAAELGARSNIRAKALAFLESLSDADKQRARDRGIMLPEGAPVRLGEG